MVQLLYCYVSVFGSDFDAEGFGREINLPGAKVRKREESRPRSPIRAIVRGNVHYWTTPRRYFNPQEVDVTDPFGDYIYEEKAIVSFVNKMQYINDHLPSYRTDTTEIWLNLIYSATDEEKFNGVFFGKELIDAVHRLGAAISTDVTFVSPDELKRPSSR